MKLLSACLEYSFIERIERLFQPKQYFCFHSPFLFLIHIPHSQFFFSQITHYHWNIQTFSDRMHFLFLYKQPVYKQLAFETQFVKQF